MNKYFIFFTTIIFSISIHAITLQEWNKLDSYQKYQALYNEEVNYKELDQKDLANLNDPKVKKEIAAGSKFILEQASDEAIYNDVDNMDIIVTIGKPELIGLNIYKIDSTTVGYQFSFYQSGGATKDDSTAKQKHFDSEEDAIKAGIDINADVNWQLHSMVEIEGDTVKEINLDIWNEGGWSWSGW